MIDFSKAAERLPNKPELVLFTREEIFSRTSENIDWSLIKTQSLSLLKNNIHIVPCNDGFTVQAFGHSSGEKVVEFCKTDESIKSAKGVCIFYNVILFRLDIIMFAVEIFYTVFSLLFNAKIRISPYSLKKKKKRLQWIKMGI